jgi:hypothetical protein
MGYGIKRDFKDLVGKKAPMQVTKHDNSQVPCPILALLRLLYLTPTLSPLLLMLVKSVK